mmetsp:Transcript_41231/g.96687  ORF Transcript_41231/g.96687 Transcript_41231/m.96687 type:complete len:131 (+) Transcript_41231:208-600(+)
MHSFIKKNISFLPNYKIISIHFARLFDRLKIATVSFGKRQFALFKNKIGRLVPIDHCILEFWSIAATNNHVTVWTSWKAERIVATIACMPEPFSMLSGKEAFCSSYFPPLLNATESFRTLFFFLKVIKCS